MAADPDASIAPGVLLVTAARNEAAHAARLADTVLALRPRPARWVVVDDASTDDTAAVVRARCAGHDWVEVVRHERTGGRADAAKARRLNEVVDRAAEDATGAVTVVVVLDADVEPPTDYLRRVTEAFDDDPTLGVFGGVCNYPVGSGLVTEPFPPDIVPGGAAAVRLATWRDIGGMWSLPHGGLDVAACLAAQHHGWTSRNDPSLVCWHHRAMGTGEGRSAVTASYRRGREDFDLGAPLWFEVVKAIRWLPRRPLLIGSAALLVGHLRSWVTRTPHTPPAWYVEHTRRRCRHRARADLERLVERLRARIRAGRRDRSPGRHRRSRPVA